MFRNIIRRRCWCLFRKLGQSLLWTPIVLGIGLFLELLASSYGALGRDLQIQIEMLLSELELLKKEFSDGLMDLEKEIATLRPKVYSEIYDDLSRQYIDKINRIAREVAAEEVLLYDADKTGKPDFALKTSGGCIVSTRSTETILKSPLALETNAEKEFYSASRIIQANNFPGECWAFKGSKGAVVIQLIAKTFITGVSIEHIAISLSPTGGTNSAMKDFSVWGLACVNDENEKYLGQFSYDNTASSIQYFEIENEPAESFILVEVMIHSNHGDPKFTCIYRIRIHGKPDLKGED